VLIGPLLARIPTIESAFVLGLVAAIAIILVSGALGIWFLFLAKNPGLETSGGGSSARPAARRGCSGVESRGPVARLGFRDRYDANGEQIAVDDWRENVATVNRVFLSWTGSGGSYFLPGAVHNWWMTGFKYGDALSVTAHPVTGDPHDPHRVLSVDNVRVDGTPDGGLTLRFRVNNVGGSPTPGYGVGIGLISK
jgi:hypothetical protein